MKLVLTEIYAISIDFMNQSDLQVMVIGKPCCAKGEGQTREGACMTPCTHACQAAVLRHVAEVKEETGYILDSSDTTKVTSACSTQCFNECKCHFMFSESNTWIKFNLQGRLANAPCRCMVLTHGSLFDIGLEGTKPGKSISFVFPFRPHWYPPTEHSGFIKFVEALEFANMD